MDIETGQWQGICKWKQWQRRQTVYSANTFIEANINTSIVTPIEMELVSRFHFGHSVQLLQK